MRLSINGNSFNLPVASKVQFSNLGKTLLDLEASLQYARALGAPDDAQVIPTAPGSCFLAEVQWSSQTDQNAAPGTTTLRLSESG